MLNIRQVEHLAAAIGFHPVRLREIADCAEHFCEELRLVDPAKAGKERLVLNVQGDLRIVQERLLRRVFVRKLSPSPYAHGGIRGRQIKTNIQVHAGSVYVLTTDICNFYPTVSRNRVYRLLVQQLGCTPDVARVLTRVCTWQHHLALGLVTSPFLAEQVLAPVDRRIGAACAAAGLRYTRFVDDLTISGGFDLKEGGFGATVEQILRHHGFKMHPDKTDYGRLSDGTPITKIVIRRGHPDVKQDYLAELSRQLEDARNLAEGRDFTGPYYTKNQIAGRVRFVCWIRPSRQRSLISKLNSINWKKLSREAAVRGFVASKKRLERMPAQ